jgi:hypothetical protein
MKNILITMSITQNFRENSQLSQLVQTTPTQLPQQVYTVQVKKQVANIIENLKNI